MHEGERIMKRVAVLPWVNKPNCFLCVSGAFERKTNYGEKWYLNAHDEREQKYYASVHTKARITFAYRSENVAAEWDGEYGPIQLWYKCEADYKEDYDEARPHWLFPFAHGNGCWSQMAVEENHLPEAFNTGDYDSIFSVLERFVISRERELSENNNAN